MAKAIRPGLKGDEIPIGSRIVSVIDAFRRHGFVPTVSRGTAL